jgi:uncharacterized SAM-binding protein YcdF (DUF218 family)
MPVKRIGRRLLILLVMLALLAGVATWAFRKVGRWLVDPDALQHARAIVVLNGKIPFRALEAADLYRQGWATGVWLLQDEPDEADETFAKLGIRHPSDQEYDQQVLERLGIPKEAIRILEPPTTNTVSETTLIADELRRQGGDKAILVTSPMHTRRTKAIWRIVVGDHPQVILRYDASEPCDPDHWWRATQDVEAVVHELLGLVNTYLGFVTKPRKR